MCFFRKRPIQFWFGYALNKRCQLKSNSKTICLVADIVIRFLIYIKELRVQIDACASVLSRKEKSEFYEKEAETFYFLVSFWFDDKIVIKCKTIDICMGETVPYTIGTSEGTRIVKWNLNGHFSDYLFIASGYRKEFSNYIKASSAHNVIPILWIKSEHDLILNYLNLNSWNWKWSSCLAN